MNETPHERFLGFPHRSSTDSSIPSWLIETGSVYVKRNVGNSKFYPLVDEVDVLQVDPHYAHILYSDGGNGRQYLPEVLLLKINLCGLNYQSQNN